jgi:general secretion pathway protein K
MLPGRRDEARRHLSAGERGYALIAALLSIVLFSLMAIAALQSARGPVVMVAAEADRARLSAAAEAGISLAIQGLMERDQSRRWLIDGTPRRMRFGTNQLDISIDDERGKIALNLINQQQATRMFAAFGLQGSELDTAVDSFLDWRDGDFDPRPFGGEFAAYEDQKIKPRNGDLRTLGELALIRGIGPELAKRIFPVATVNFGNGAFDDRYASALARIVSTDVEDEASLASADAPVREGQVRRAFTSTPSDVLIGRPLTIRVEAQDGRGGSARRSAIIELTGAATRPFVIRGRE